MPTEARHIYFNEEEITWALVEYCRLKKEAIKSDHVTELVYTEGEKIGATLLLQRPGNATLTAVKFTNADLGAAIIIFCHDIHLPLPHWGAKSLKAEGKTLSLQVMKEEKVDFAEIAKMKVVHDITKFMK